MKPEEHFEKLLNEELEKPCEDTYPTICKRIRSDHGKKMVANMVTNICEKEGLSIQQAMAQIESDL